ncbi:hypothetical protein [Alicyclobacillus ferrooxydans]|uniref:Zinc-finger domain-containing protein n=1 Tax=Alicyclobacillus ferrooxydans TaxID=471514 RepID=A0A0P9D1F2_9BACL|nr:hypothetical protein [Alicyclobacillus ferrooxydans]KPV43330.1 hypothetical protein AN477_12785 [Alicyclobacillus ferrooxydans]
MKHLQSQQAWAYIEDEMEWHQKLKYDRHLEECMDCRRLLDDTRRLQQSMIHAMDAEVPAMPPDFHAQLLDALHKDAESPAASRTLRSKHLFQRRIRYGVSSAATVVLALGIGWFTLHGKLSLPSPTPAHNSVAMGMTGDVTGHQTRKGPGGGVSHHRTNGVLENLASPAQAPANIESPGQAALATTTVPDRLNGLALFQVKTPSGQPIANAHVSVMAGGQLLATGLTGENGQVRPLQLSVPVDPVLYPLFSTAAIAEQGTMTVVVWKQGYRPVVSYDVRVFAGGSSQFSQSLTLQPAAGDPPPILAGYGFSRNGQGYQTSTVAAFVNWVKQAVTVQSVDTAAGQVQKVTSMVGTSNTAQGPGHVAVTVLNQNGRPVEGAQVAVVAGSHISGSGHTNANGVAPVIATSGIADWRFIGPWNISNLSPQITAVVVWKQGYAPAVGMYVPISSTSPTDVTVKLDSLSWRKSMGWNNLSAPSTIAPERLPTTTNAMSYLAWATGQGY